MLSSLIHWQATDTNTRKADSVYVLLCVFKMVKMIEHPANCEIQSVIRFVNATNVKLADIHCQIHEVYGENAMSDGMVKWVKKLNGSHDNVHDESLSGQPSVVRDDLVCVLEAKAHEDTWFTILSLSLHFQQISRNHLYKIVTQYLDFQKLCSRWVLKIFSKAHKKKRAASALTFLTRYSEQGDGFLSHIVTGDEIWVSQLTPEFHEVEAHLIAEKAQIQAHHFNQQDHVHSFLG